MGLRMGTFTYFISYDVQLLIWIDITKSWEQLLDHCLIRQSDYWKPRARVSCVTSIEKSADDACQIQFHTMSTIFFSIFFSHSVSLDSLTIIVLDCPSHLLTSTSNCATCGAHIGEDISNLARWSYQWWFEKCLCNLVLWCRFSSLGLVRGIGKDLTQYLGSLVTMDHKGCIATKKYFPEPI